MLCRSCVILSALFSSSAQEMIRIPGGSAEVVDQITTLKIRVYTSEFLLSTTEVTQQEYQKITSKNPSVYPGAKRPVENVSWWDAILYCNRRSAREGLARCYNEATGRRDPACTGYRLPTEAEWRHAAGPLSAADSNLGVSSTKTTTVLTSAAQQGHAPVGSRAANSFGLFDMFGNVWEWCEDYFDVIASPNAIRNPTGPASGVAKVIRGGSFLSTTSRWSRDYRSSMNAAERSRYTGFRVARSLSEKLIEEPVNRGQFLEPYQAAPLGFESSTGALAPILSPGMTAEGWRDAAKTLRMKWERLLQPPQTAASVKATLVRGVSQRNFSGQILALETEPGISEKIYVIEPSAAARRPLPVMIVPFYDVDTPAAVDLGGRNYDPAKGVNAFAYTAAQHGYLAIAVRWFGESYGESYSEAVANLALRHPGSTGLGKWVADARRVCDFIATLPDADSSRIGIIGHSLGGKMAMYAAALEPRIRAVVASEPGVGFRFSNYDDYWYWGERFTQIPAGTDQHELLALIAPCPFLLIGGDEYDKSESWHYINAARPVYRLLGSPGIGYLNHHTGHTPSPGSIVAAFDWLDYFLRP